MDWTDTQGYDSLLTGQYFQFAGRMDGGSPAPLENGNMVFTYGFGSREAREAGARFVVTRDPLLGTAPLFQGDGAYVYEDREALPRIRAALEREEFFMKSSPPTQLAFEGNGDRGITDIVVADQWYPGWQAWFDGIPAAVNQGPDIFRTITLTPQMKALSRTKVYGEMRYEPEAFRVGLYALCLALGGAAAITAAALTKRIKTGI